MAVEAHHLLHTGGAEGQGQLLANAGWAWSGDAAAACYEAPATTAARPQQGQRSPCYGGKPQAVAAAGRPAAATTGQQVFQQSSCVANPAPAAGQLAMMPGQYFAAGPRMCAADASESGVTFGGGVGGAQQEVVMMAPRKRKRADQGQTTPVLGLGAADVAAHFQQQLADVDRLVLQHTTKMWVELGEQRRRHARQVVAAVEAAAAKRLRAKDEEIQRIGRLNWALEERVRSLCVEAQVWRDLAQSNEATAIALRAELRQAHDAQQARRCEGADDAESCCCGDNGVAGGGIGADGNDEGEEAGTSSSSAGSHGRMCTVCGEGAAAVLLLPCRHLCACAPCAAAALACPACGCAKNGSVCVNFS